MPVLVNIGILLTCPAGGGPAELGEIPEAAVAWRGGRIAWVGPERDLPGEYDGEERLDARGGVTLPGLIDCHTHLAFAGWREEEFEQRILGKSYHEIARAGGGILSTVARTRAADEEALAARCAAFLRRMAALGVTTVEAKTGYGLSTDHELRLLRVYRRLAEIQPVTVVPTLLAAHVVPPEYRHDRRTYVRAIIEEMIPHAANERLARFCDVFVEEGAFTPAEAEEILHAARARGLIPKVHADQLTASGGAELAARLGAASAAHLEHTSDAGLDALREAGVVAVLLPLAALCTRQAAPDARRLVERGVRVAVATDFNPGTAPSFDLPLALWLACTMSRLTPREAIRAATIHAARALRLEDEVGSIEPGKCADLCVLDSPTAGHWLYHLRPDRCRVTIKNGETIFEAQGQA